MEALVLGALALVPRGRRRGIIPRRRREQVLTIGTALRGGIYLRVGEAICRLVDADREERRPSLLACAHA
jgi:TRAP-type uncharacterized transport system substrate-binding protein